MEWREATERLMRCGVPLSAIADAAGLAHVTLRQTRLAPGSVESAFDAVGVRPAERPERLSPSDFARLAAEVRPDPGVEP